MFPFNNTTQLATDVLIIGAGAAGIRAAIALKERGFAPVMISKREFGDAHTQMASGGINASLATRDKEDRWEIHAADTLKEGHYINNPQAVEVVCKHAAEAINELHSWGCPFNKTENGKIDQRFFGAQSFRRTCFVGDKTGRAILDTLVDKAKAMDIPCYDGVYVFEIIKNNGKVTGAIGFDKKKAEMVYYKTHNVVLATGGYASVYSRSSSRYDENLGDTVYLAFESGAQLMDMEMVQFHPTGMVKPEEFMGKLVTEAVRGEGGHLLNKNKERFMEIYSPEMMELDARDEVARAITKEISKGNGTKNNGVYLDISHKDKDFIKSRLPKMYERFKELGIDISKEPMEVAPTSHYSMGGVLVDFNNGSTGVEGLYAVGEAAGGLHGANRLGGNSLIETVVLGRLTGETIAANLHSHKPITETGNPDELVNTHFKDTLWHAHPEKYIKEIRELMWEHAGIIRDEGTLEKGLRQLSKLKDKMAKEKPLKESTADLFWQNRDLKSVLLTAEMILLTAKYRKESRGAHFREDYPDKNDEWQINTLCSKGVDNNIQIETRHPGEISKAVQKAIDENHSLDYHQLE